MKRQEMLSRIRTALDKNNLKETGVAKTDGSEVVKRGHAPQPFYSGMPSSKENLHMRFTLEAKKNGTALIEIEDRKKIPLKLKDYFSQISCPHSFIRCFDNETCDLPWTSGGLVVDGDAISSEDKIGMTLAWGAIAETGTLMCISSPHNPSSLSFLPELHIIILKASQIFISLEDAFAHLLKAYNKKRLPHAINLISGASRTGDIGGHIVHGAHGPMRLGVVLIKNE